MKKLFTKYVKISAGSMLLTIRYLYVRFGREFYKIEKGYEEVEKILFDLTFLKVINEEMGGKKKTTQFRFRIPSQSSITAGMTNTLE